MPDTPNGLKDGVSLLADAKAKRDLRSEAMLLSSKYGGDAYYDFVLAHGRRPDRKEAVAIGKLLGRQVRAADGSLQPRPSKAARLAERAERMAERANLAVDIELNRALDAIAFLAKNELDPAPLLARVSSVEEETLNAEIEKAVLWLNRFANGWRSHVNLGIQEAEGSPSGDGGQVGRHGFRLVRCSD